MKPSTSGSTKQTSEFPKTVTVKGIPGITATIYRQSRQKPDKQGTLQTYVSFLVGYAKDGKRHMEAHSDLAEAEVAAKRTAVSPLIVP
jgi:hypothetical protein